MSNSKVNGLSILSAVLLAAVVVLGISTFSLHKKTKALSDKNVKEKALDTIQDLKIAFFYSDSIMESYKLVPVMAKELESERNKLEKSLLQKQRNLESRYKRLVKNVENMAITSTEAQNEEQSIMKGQQDLVGIQQEYAAQISQKEFDMNLILLDSVRSAIDSYNSDKTFDYIINYKRNTGDVFYVNQSLDITPEILSILNERYKEVETE